MEEIPGSAKAFNTSLLFDPSGKLIASYRKIHLFDVDLANKVSARESDTRAAGETAPLLFTIGAARKSNTNVFEGANTALSTQIFRNATQPFPGAVERAWGAALTLIVLVVVLTIVARIVTKRFAVALS